NFDQSSCQMEHQILINILEEITPVFRENGLLLDIAIDGDLDTSDQKDNYDKKSIEEKKTLPLTPDDDKLHYTQTEILFEHLCDLHDNCWEKKIDYPKSFASRHAMALLHNNLEKNCEQCDFKREENIKNINVRNTKKHDQLNQLKHDMPGFNFDQDLIPYGLRLQEKLNNNEFLPSFHEYIYNFKSLIKCQNCHSFPKYDTNGLSLLFLATKT
ncbi:3036_t:CDS:2, partial [Entrophospora sp. SA101]